jgi:hypothetical protein
VKCERSGSLLAVTHDSHYFVAAAVNSNVAAMQMSIEGKDRWTCSSVLSCGG